MVNLHPKNQKLVERSIRMVRQVTGLSAPEAMHLIERAGDSVPIALVMHSARVDRAAAERRLKKAGGSVRKAIAAR